MEKILGSEICAYLYRNLNNLLPALDELFVDLIVILILVLWF